MTAIQEIRRLGELGNPILNISHLRVGLTRGSFLSENLDSELQNQLRTLHQQGGHSLHALIYGDVSSVNHKLFDPLAKFAENAIKNNLVLPSQIDTTTLASLQHPDNKKIAMTEYVDLLTQAFAEGDVPMLLALVQNGKASGLINLSRGTVQSSIPFLARELVTRAQMDPEVENHAFGLAYQLFHKLARSV